jgi:hypothetical protein
MELLSVMGDLCKGEIGRACLAIYRACRTEQVDISR